MNDIFIGIDRNLSYQVLQTNGHHINKSIVLIDFSLEFLRFVLLVRVQLVKLLTYKMLDFTASSLYLPCELNHIKLSMPYKSVE